MRVLAAILVARALASGSAKSRRNRARGNARSAINVVVMMRCRNAELHAECHQRQPDKSEATSRYFHLGLQLSPFGTSLPLICRNRGGRGRVQLTSGPLSEGSRNKLAASTLVLARDSGRLPE